MSIIRDSQVHHQSSTPCDPVPVPGDSTYGPGVRIIRYTVNRKSFWILADEYNNWIAASRFEGALHSLSNPGVTLLPVTWLTAGKVASILEM